MFFRTAGGGRETAEDVSKRSTRTWSSSTGGDRVSSSSSLSGISNGSGGAYEREGDSGGGGGGNEQEAPPVVGVAVGKEVKECKANLMWVLSNMDAIIDKARRKPMVVLLHVHRPAKTIPFSTRVASLLYIHMYISM